MRHNATAGLAAMGAMTILGAGAAMRLGGHAAGPGPAALDPERFGGAGGPCALFYPGTPWEVVQHVSQSMQAQAVPAPRYDVIQSGEGFGSPWFTGGTSGPLTYSFVPDGVNIPAGFSGDLPGQNVLFQRMNALFGSPAAWKPIFAATFTRWSQITGIDYTEVSDDGASFPGSAGSSARGAIRIAMRNIDGAFGILAFNQYPQGGDMVLDSSENWAQNAANNNYRFLRNTVMHEHGHGIGIQHICPVNQSKLMEPFLSTVFDGPQHDDIRGGQFLYGDRYEPNGGLANATLLGFLPHGSQVAIQEVSLRNTTDVDMYSFTASPNSRLTVAISPVGATYDQEPQDSNGSCGPGVSFDSTNISNLQFAILNQNGTTLTTVNATGFRGAEQLINYVLPTNGLYHVRVSAAASSSNYSQVYSTSISVQSAAAPCPADSTGDGVVNSSDLANVLGVWGAAGGPMDYDHDGVVNATDLAYVLGQWGNCPA